MASQRITVCKVMDLGRGNDHRNEAARGALMCSRYENTLRSIHGISGFMYVIYRAMYPLTVLRSA